jgi:hypothetical protein
VRSRICGNSLLAAVDEYVIKTCASMQVSYGVSTFDPATKTVTFIVCVISFKRGVVSVRVGGGSAPFFSNFGGAHCIISF